MLELFDAVNYHALTVRTCRNWYDIAAVRFGLRPEAIITYRNGTTYFMRRSDSPARFKLAHRCIVCAAMNGVALNTVNQDTVRFQLGDTRFETQLDEYAYLLIKYATKLYASGCKFPSEGKLEMPNGLQLSYLANDISAFCHIWETFFEETYGRLHVKGKEVVDVGASFGDTAIYFAMHGASKVYAYEPLREVFPYLVRNINANELGQKVLPFMKAISSEKGHLYLKPEARWLGNSSVAEATDELGYWVEAEPLSLKAQILKMDCEGHEYEILSSIDLSSMGYEEAMIEFHRGSSSIVKLLSKAGYHVKIIMEDANETHGILYARK